MHRHIPTLVLFAGLTAGAAACAGSSDPETSTTVPAGASATAAGTGGGAEIAAPVMVELATAGGTVVTARTGQTVVLSTDEPTEWSGKVADASVATFVAGRNDGSATFNPALTDLRPGKTAVTLTDGTETVTFTLEVTAA